MFVRQFLKTNKTFVVRVHPPGTICIRKKKPTNKQNWNCVNSDKLMMSNVKKFRVGISNFESVCRGQNSTVVWTAIFALNSTNYGFLIALVIDRSHLFKEK